MGSVLRYVWNNKRQIIEVQINGKCWMYLTDARILNTYYTSGEYKKHQKNDIRQ